MASVLLCIIQPVVFSIWVIPPFGGNVLMEVISPYHTCVIRRRRFTQTTDYDMNPDPALRPHYFHA
jgi:hypothetical protein